ncbi:MAG: hypothetical protein ACE3L7_20610 [Candidatus Pristimantibacillus sp.]
MQYKRWRRSVIIIIILAVLLFISYRMYNYVNDFYRNDDVTRVVLYYSEVKAGLFDTTTKTAVITEQEEINELIRILNKRTVLKALPIIGPVKTNENDRTELRIMLKSSSKGTLEYMITSEGDAWIRKSNDDLANTIILKGSVISWFTDLRASFELREDSVK